MTIPLVLLAGGGEQQRQDLGGDVVGRGFQAVLAQDLPRRRQAHPQATSNRHQSVEPMAVIHKMTVTTQVAFKPGNPNRTSLSGSLRLTHMLGIMGIRFCKLR